MNLTTDSWIPVVTRDGGRRLISLQETFDSAHEIRDVSVKPHEKIALLRLLICITQAALDGPEDYREWKTCRDAIQPKVKRYLENWAKAFELFGDGPRFLQVPGLKAAKEEGEGNPATKLDLTLASGNNASLFDNAAGIPRAVPPARLALTLLAFQCFSPCGRIGVVKWNGSDTPGEGASKHAPCTSSSMLNTYVQGASLLETIHFNLLNKEDVNDMPGAGWGVPVWEKSVAGASDKEAVANATLSYLGRLVPLSRAIRLDAAGWEMVLANGLEYPLAPIFREAAATWEMRTKGIAVLGAMLERSIWRQLSSITVQRIRKADPVSGPLALRNIVDQGCAIWVGALVAAGNGKIEDVVEAAYDVPAGMFGDAGRKLYENGVALADQWQEALARSVKAYASTLKLEPVPYERARQHFWTAVEQHVPVLLKLTDAPETAGDLKDSPWGVAVKQCAADAFEFACPHGNPRQIQAHAAGLQQLFLPKTKDPNAPRKARGKSTKTV